MRIDATKARSIFISAVENHTPDHWDKFLDDACAEDVALRKRVELLLKAHQGEDSFLDRGHDDDLFDPIIDRPITEKPGDPIGPYTLLQQIGEGGMGVVYMAEQERPVRRTVAVKIIKPGMDSAQVIARFEAERQALALMDHPNIAKVLEAGATEAGRPYFVMELVQGVQITNYCDQCNLTTRARLELFVKVCQAVQHAHQKGIIHRDIKPSNVMIAMQDGMPAPKIIDFGVAKAINQRLTEHTLTTAFAQMVGTPLYMSPEQAELSPLGVDTRSDIYSLGVLLYELLTGTTTIDKDHLHAASYDEVRRIIREEEPPRPSSRISTLAADLATTVAVHRRSDPRRLLQTVRGELDWIVMKALEKDRNRRYESASSFAADIERFLSDEAVEACPPSTLYRLRKFVRRNRHFVIGAAGLLLILLLGLIGTSRGLYRARVAEKWANREAENARVAESQATRDRDDAIAAREAEAEALANAVLARKAERRLNFSMAFDRGLGRCDQGQVGRGMLWLARALELAPPEETEMRRVILANLNAWRRELHSLEAIFPHKETVITAAFSPSGKLIVTGSVDKSAQLWEVETGSRRGQPMLHNGDVHEAVFSPDESRILTGNHDGTAQLWETATGARIRTFPQRGNVPAAAFSPDGTWFVTGATDGTVTIWNAASLEPIGRPLKHQNLVHDVAISSDGSYILTACHDNNGRLWDFETRQLIATFQHDTRVGTVDFRRPECNMIVTGDLDGNVYLWDVSKAIADDDKTLEAEAREFAGEPWRHHGGIHRLHVSRDGSRILTASFDNTARLWDPTTGVQVGAAFDHQGAVQSAAFSPDGSRVVTACEDNAARLWQPAAGQSVHTIEHPGLENHEAVYTEDGLYMLSKSDPETALVRDAVTGAPIGVPFPHPEAVRAVAVNHDASLILTGSPDSITQLWNARSGKRRFDPFPTGGSLWDVDFSPDGTRMLTGGSNGKVELRDVATGVVLGEPWEIAARIYQAAFSPDGARIVVTSGDKIARLYNATEGNIPRRLEGHQGTVFGVAFSPDGARIVTGSYDNTARVWDAATGLPVSAPMSHKGAIWWCVAFSPDGRSVVTGCDDGTVRVWDVATAKPIGPALVHEAGVRMVAFGDNSQIRTGTTVGTVRLWQASTSPLEDDVERINLWVQVATGFELDSDGMLIVLDVETWQQRRNRLDELGTPKTDERSEGGDAVRRKRPD